MHEVEAKVATAYAKVKVVQLGPGTDAAKWALHLSEVRKELTKSLAGMRAVNRREVRSQRARIESLNEERAKLLEAFYADALPVDLLKAEQARLARELGAAEVPLARAEADLDELNRVFEQALAAARTMETTYAEATGTDRRLWNQALFDCFRVRPDEAVEGELREEFRILTAADTPRRLRAECRPAASSGRGSNKDLSL